MVTASGMPKAAAEQALRAKASAVFGSGQAGETWFNTPAMALDYKRPTELLGMPAGVRAVECLLAQVEHCVYI